MSQENKIKWISLQPLTGGMYIGFANTFKCDAECIISYKGLADEGKNEYHLMKWLEKNGRNIPRFAFKNIDLTYNGDGYVDLEYDHSLNESYIPDFKDVDVVCAVPICSGLSMLATTDKETKDIRNCNMKFLAKWTLKTIKPKAYVFENAPAFMSDKNAELREWFENLATECGYAISYFRTDTIRHYNCQSRPRTFIIMSKSDGIHRARYIDDWIEDHFVPVEKMFAEIPAEATQQNILPAPLYENVVTMEYAQTAKIPGIKNWRELFKGDVINNIMKFDLLEDFYLWCQKHIEVPGDFYSRMVKHIEHIADCMEKGKGWWSANPKYYPNKYGAVQSRTVFSTIHPTEDRLLNVRELLTLMGMPYDFELQGDFMKTGRQIGQNVPVKTAEWIARLTLRIIAYSGFGTSDQHSGARYYDNIKQEIVY